MKPDVEVLVHIAAPSTAGDDARYRSLAQAYLDFDAACSEAAARPERLELTDLTDLTDSGVHGAAQQSLDGSFDISALSFQSVWGNTNSPDIRGKQMEESLANKITKSTSSERYVSPTSAIPDSQSPSQEARAGSRTKAAMTRQSLADSLDRLLDSSFISDSQKSESLAPHRRDVSPDLSVLARTPRKRPLGPLSPRSSQLLPSTKRPAHAERAGQRVSRHERDKITTKRGDVVIPSSFLSDASLSNADLMILDGGKEEDGQPASSFRDDIPSSLPEECGRVISDRGTGSVPNSSAGSAAVGMEIVPPNTDDRSTRATVPKSTQANTLRILSPEPPVACEHLNAASLITDKLAKLALDLDLDRRYRPSFPTIPITVKGPRDKSTTRRPLRPFERGFWRISTDSWPATLRHRAWTFLSQYVGRGDAGWGVWCSRDEAPHTWLRLHCFAAAAGHTYLLLYLASQRHVLTTGADWLDGSCTPMITVQPRARRTAEKTKVSV